MAFPKSHQRWLPSYLASLGSMFTVTNSVSRSNLRASAMAINLPKRQASETKEPVIKWLLDSDPSIRWQVMRDLIGSPVEEVAAERARVATKGAGARLLSLQAADGRWGGVAWNRGWNSTMHVLILLRDLGLDPASDQARRATDLVRERVMWKGCGPKECRRNSKRYEAACQLRRRD